MHDAPPLVVMIIYNKLNDLPLALEFCYLVYCWRIYTQNGNFLHTLKSSESFWPFGNEDIMLSDDYNKKRGAGHIEKEKEYSKT